MPAQNDTPSFREMKMAQLRTERGEPDRPASRPEAADPDPIEEDDRAALAEGSEDVDDGEEVNASEDTPADDEDLDEYEAAEDDGAEDDTDDEELEVRLERTERERAELEKELSRVTANRKEREQEYANAQQNFVQMRHEMEDSLTELRRGAEWYASLADGQLQQLQSVNPAQLPPEQQSQYYQQLNQATQYAQQMKAAFQQAAEREKAERDRLKQREADVALAVIKARIPDWNNELYQELGTVAQDYGATPEQFGEITDPLTIQLLYNELRNRRAKKTVTKKLDQRKAKPPRSRSGKPQARNERGQFEKAKREFTPNTRGSFARMKLAELQMENRRRGS